MISTASHPVIFTKRSTSIIANGEDIYPHANFTETLDYEGEIGVIIGKGGFQISEKDAMDHVWGCTIINDVTARERQRDHKQFYIGKSGDTFCPMGPIAVPLDQLPKKLRVQTFINGVKRQDGTTDDLIFSIANLVKTLSEGTTLCPGDVIATGTPAGVGFGQEPPTFLKPGDTVEISVSGLGSLKNRVAKANSTNPTVSRLACLSLLPTYNLEATCGGAGLTRINNKLLNILTLGPDTSSAPTAVFVHGLGGSTEFFRPLLTTSDLFSTHKNILFDLEGHGLSPTKADACLSIDSYTGDLAAVFEHAGIDSGAVLVAHSMGCLVAMTFALRYPDKVSKLILLGPPPSPLPAAAADAQNSRGVAVRAGGMKAVADAVASAGTGKKTTAVALSAVRGSLLSQSPEGYAKGCMALGGSAGKTIEWEKMSMPTLIVTGDEDKVCPVELVKKMEGGIKDVKVQILGGMGHWSVSEDAEGVGKAVQGFLGG